MKKCLILDLDNTLWKGTLGEDGVDSIEPDYEFQRYIADLKACGVVLAVCSKNDNQLALSAFDRWWCNESEGSCRQLLVLKDFAAFVANWKDKSDNIRSIADLLNLGLDSMVFVDDSPYERELVKARLPMVDVVEPKRELIEPFFQPKALTAEDLQRTKFYQDNLKREELRAAVSLPEYLSSLNMRLIWSKFEQDDLPRVLQLINKTNQFNLMTRRYTEDEIKAVKFGLQFRLVDRFGDNGLIAVVIGDRAHEDLYLNTWLMSCRVLGRGVERAVLNVTAERAKRAGYKGLLGEYHRTSRNQIVADLYSELGFVRADNLWRLPLDSYKPHDTFIEAKRYQAPARARANGNEMDHLADIFRRVFCDPDLIITKDTNADDVAGWDSLSNIRLMMMVEKVFGIEFATGEMEELKSVGDFSRLINAKMDARLDAVSNL